MGFTSNLIQAGATSSTSYHESLHFERFGGVRQCPVLSWILRIQLEPVRLLGSDWIPSLLDICSLPRLIPAANTTLRMSWDRLLTVTLTPDRPAPLPVMLSVTRSVHTLTSTLRARKCACLT